MSEAPLLIFHRLCFDIMKFMRVFSLSVTCIFSCFVASAQYDSLLKKTYAERAPWLWKIGASVHIQPDSTAAFTIAGGLIEFGRKNKDAALQLEGELYAVFYLTKYFPGQKERIVASLKNIIQRASGFNSREVQWKAKQVLAGYYFYDLYAFEAAFEEYNDLYRILLPVTFREFPDKIHIMYYIGMAYFYFKDYAKAIQYFSENPGLYPANHFQHFMVHSVNNIAAAYQQMGRLDSSDYYSNLVYEYAVKVKDSTWMGIIKGNLGNNEYLRGRFDQAFPLLKACVAQAITDNDWGLASKSLITLSEIYFKQYNIPAANAALLQAEEFVKRSPQYQYERYSQLYSLQAKMYAYQGNPKMSVRYMDSAAYVTDSLNRRFSGLLLSRALQKDAIVQQKAKMVEVENRKKLLNLKFYAFLIIAALAFVVTLFIYRNKRLKHKQEQVLKDMQLKEKEKELQMTREQLLDFTRHLAEKNELIQQHEEQNGNRQVMQELEQTVILTGKDWGRFRELFEKVHPGYLQRLVQKIPGISPAEIRLMALAKLNFSNKEMASALGVTPQSIRVTWHRLRKKVDLGEEGSSDELVDQI
jgi:DNA-binding CsgD family transcriptional regulator/tetratricopeptide (TPR) repeat protein